MKLYIFSEMGCPSAFEVYFSEYAGAFSADLIIPPVAKHTASSRVDQLSRHAVAPRIPLYASNGAKALAFAAGAPSATKG